MMEPKQIQFVILNQETEGYVVNRQEKWYDTEIRIHEKQLGVFVGLSLTRYATIVSEDARPMTFGGRIVRKRAVK